jgi:two-component system, sensor histidine kinase PdtaS
MANRFLSLMSLLLLLIPAGAQDITRQEVDSMLKVLKKSSDDLQRVDLLLQAAQFHILKPGELQKDFDSALVYINEVKEMNNSLKSSTVSGYLLLTESYMVKEKGQSKEARQMVEKAIPMLEAGNNKTYWGSAVFELSRHYDYNDNEQLSKKMALVNQAVNIFQQSGNLVKKAACLEALGDLYNITGEYDKTIVVLQQSLAAYDSAQYKKLQGVYIMMGVAYLYKSNHSQALSYMLKALKTAHEVQDTSMQLCQINNYLGIVYQEIDRKDMSVKYLSDALATARKHNDEFATYLLATNISVSYNDLGKPGQALEVLSMVPQKFLASDNYQHKLAVSRTYLRTYMELKEYDKAKPYCDTLLSIAATNLVNDQFRNNIYRVAANYYFYTNQYAKARYYLTKNIPIAEKIHYDMGTINDSKIWYKLDSAQGDFRSAFNYLLFYKTKMDSVYSASKLRQFAVLNVEYEIGMKEDSIKLRDKDILLLKQKNTFQQANLKQASLIKNITIAGIALAIIIMTLLYRQYRQKKRSSDVISNKNEQLQHLLTEKEWLLKEIHHRVKNNLQIVMSLLNSQSAYIDNEPALTAIHDSQHRVHAMSLIHQKLYNTDNVASIDMSLYIRELVSYLAESYTTGQRIRFEFDIEDLELDVTQAVPVGLILNEAITNSIKYAFPNERSGLITISLASMSPHHYLLTIADNGVGMPDGSKNKKAGSLGMSLMGGLAEDLDGSFEIDTNNGTSVKISFVHDTNVKRPQPLVSSFVTNN